MQNSDVVFYKEFNNMMNERRAMPARFGYVDLPFPELSTMIMGTPKRKMCFIGVSPKNEWASEDGKITEPYFEVLNGTTAELVGKTTLQKRQFLSDGSFRRDKNGDFVTTDVPVKKDSVAILSPVNIHLKTFEYDERGHKKNHNVSDGFKYVDYIKNPEDGSVKYIYIIPKKYVHLVNLCALVITLNKHRNYYKGSRLALQNGNWVYIYVIPYKYRENPSYRVCGVKDSTDFDEEVNNILTFWYQMGIIFDLNLTVLQNQVKGQNNAAIVDLDPTLDVSDYVAYDKDKSLADENIDEEFDFNAFMSEGTIDVNIKK